MEALLNARGMKGTRETVDLGGKGELEEWCLIANVWALDEELP